MKRYFSALFCAVSWDGSLTKKEFFVWWRLMCGWKDFVICGYSYLLLCRCITLLFDL
uniref:Uncharacterized protein n=1 Tax=Anguilla anguilla TaxID=7936 RepID=A0A0E9V424_ANGAN